MRHLQYLHEFRFVEYHQQRPEHAVMGWTDSSARRPMDSYILLHPPNRCWIQNLVDQLSDLQVAVQGPSWPSKYKKALYIGFSQIWTSEQSKIQRLHQFSFSINRKFFGQACSIGVHCSPWLVWQSVWSYLGLTVYLGGHLKFNPF